MKRVYVEHTWIHHDVCSNVIVDLCHIKRFVQKLGQLSVMTTYDFDELTTQNRKRGHLSVVTVPLGA